MRSLSRRFRLAFFLWLAVPFGLAGCSDALTRPEVALLAQDNAAVLQLLADLPALPHLLERSLARANARRTAADSVRLTTLTPRTVALALIGDAEQRLGGGGEGEGDEGARITRERARHLLRGAAEAVEEEDYPRAIRRAYYAGQLLDALDAGRD
jgi:hypothetical protein